MAFFELIADHIAEYRGMVSVAQEATPLPVMVTGLSHVHKAHFLAALADEAVDKPMLVLAESEAECSRLADDINTMAMRQAAYQFPSRDINLGSVEAASREYEYRRLGVMTRLLEGKCDIVVATPEAAAQLTVPRKILASRQITIKSGDDIKIEELAARLVAAGFSRCDMVEGVSQFSVRGSIIDVYPINTNMPVRIELWGDSIDTVSVFDLESQRRIDTLKSVTISPSLELLFDNNDILCKRINDLAEKLRGKNAEKARAILMRDANRLKNGLPASNPDKYFPLAYDEPETLFDYTKFAVVCEISACDEGFRATAQQHTEDLTMMFESGELCKGLDRYMLTKPELRGKLDEYVRVYLENFMRGADLRLSHIYNCSAVQLSSWSGEYALLSEELSSYLKRGYTAVVYAGTDKAAKQLADDLKGDGFAAEYTDNPRKLYMGRAYIMAGTLSAGFEYGDAKCVCLTHAAVSVARQTAQKAKKKKKKGEEIKSLTDISIGDIVVHTSYGIGIFEGVTKLTSDNISKDYIKIKYAGQDVLYVPVTQLDMLSRYIGSGDINTIKLNKLHSDQWEKTKTKAKAAAMELAQELIELYAKRMKSRGYPFSPDGNEQRDFDGRFSYVETDDQLNCIDDIKKDMQRDVPMDRLLCGDVGFGKTEVALRGAFKCIMEGKQCALLCPTTVLAWQHYQTVLKRMEGFPVNVELLSRFRTAKEQRIILDKLRHGIIDMVIGTHRLVQPDVEFKDLGLVIIDEEQRFGVAHKDKFKEMFAGVDILSLSATPIPRTLNMAMSGIRDMSVLETPPQDRQPITTYVLEHDWGVIAKAIEKELRRNGQVYYIHNRIESIYSCAAKLQELLPEARIGVAHGKMTEDELLEEWRKLLEQEIDVLVCTTIIETGVDVPNCNTLVIENADNLGLAQLHQLRGRVGRTNRRAYAYFTFKRGKALSEIATKRLNAIREFTQFGSGFRIAMRDLEIRGAGSILGASQSGHMSAVGYDMYVRLLNEAVAETNGQQPEKQQECLIDVKVDAYIPEDYISNQAQRIACYRRIASIRDDEQAYDVTDELIDRYGEIPKSVEGLVEVAKLRSIAESVGVNEITQAANDISFYCDKPNMKKVGMAINAMGNRLAMDVTGRFRIIIKLKPAESPLTAMSNVLAAMSIKESE